MLEVFKELEVTGASTALDSFIDRVSHALPRGWKRSHVHEKSLQATAGRRLFAFHSEARVGWPAVNLFLARDPGGFKVTNIVPEESTRLTRSQYNAVLNEFVDQVVQPAAERLGLAISLSDEQVSITRWLSEDAAQRLLRFSENANKGTGSAHPLDFKRWAAFLIQAHRDKSRLDAETLLRWLVEEEHWPEDTADRLAIEFEFARDLLAAYDAER